MSVDRCFISGLSRRFNKIAVLCFLCFSMIVTSGSQLRAEQRQMVQYIPRDTEQRSDEREVETFRDPFDQPQDTKDLKLSDPIEPVNRATFWVNDKLYLYGLDPVARGWYYVVPWYGRQGIRNFFDNLDAPNSLFNSLLQGEPGNAGITTSRFIVNTTFGLAGFFDPAGYWLEPVDEDFDKTFATWGIGPGPYFMIPFMGPSTARGSVALIFDNALAPLNYADGEDAGTVLFGLTVVENVNTVSFHLGEYQSFKQGAVDPYIGLKDVYEQRLQQGEDLFD